MSFLGKLFSSPAPPPPDYAALAAAQGQANINSANFNTGLNRVNQVGPNGTTTWSSTPGANSGDPAQWTQTTTLSPDQQHQLDQTNALSNNLIGQATSSLAAGPQHVGAPSQSVGIDPTLALSYMANPAQATAGQGTAGTVGPTQTAQAGTASGDSAIRSSFDTSGVTSKIPTAVDNNYMQSVQGALMSRLQPQQDRDMSMLRSRLLNSGIEVGTDAYNREMNVENQKENDARMQAIVQSGTEGRANAQLQANLQGQEFGQALQTGQFGQNADTEMAKNQLAASLANASNRTAVSTSNARSADAASQLQAQLATQTSNNNAGLATQTSNNNASMWNTNRQNTAADVLSAGNLNLNVNNSNSANNIAAAGFNNNASLQPLNALTALHTGSQVSMPGSGTAPVYTGGQAGAAPVYQAGVDQGNYNMGVYNGNIAGQNGLYGAFGSLAGGIGQAGGIGNFLSSDIRLKENIHKVGEHPSGVGRYAWDWKDGSGSSSGVLAQELARVRPDAVAKMPSGFLGVNYDAIGGH